MFEKVTDGVRGLAVHCIADGGVPEDDFRLHVESIETDLVELQRTYSGTVVVLISIEPGMRSPDPRWRKEIARAIGALDADRLLAALVIHSTLQRGVFTAINWITGKSKNSGAFATPELASEWLSHQRREPLPQLGDMLASARAAAELSARAAGPTARRYCHTIPSTVRSSAGVDIIL